MRNLSAISGLKDELPTITRSYHERAIERRLRLSRLMMVAYMASIPVFTNTPAQLSSAPSLFLTTITRGKGGDPWGGTRVGALLHLPDVVAAVHYVCTGIGNVSPVDEISVLANQSAVVKDGDRAFFFAGDSYDEILKELSLMNGDENSKLVSYGTAWRTMPFPVYLLPCGETGARQLRIMSIPNYRQWASQCLLQAEYEPPPDGQPDWDGMYQGRPFVMAADMDLRRIDRAIAAAERAGYDCISMAAMDVQGQEVLQPRYMDTGKARLYVWSQEAEAATFGEPFLPSPTTNKPFMTEKGEYVDAPLIQADRKGGGQSRKQIRELV